MIIATDVPLVLRIAFYYDNITFHSSEGDSEELFNKPHSYKTIMDGLKKFFEERKHDKHFEENKTRLTYADFVDFSYFFIANNDKLFLTHGGKTNSDSSTPWVAEAQSGSMLERELRLNI